MFSKQLRSCILYHVGGCIPIILTRRIAHRNPVSIPLCATGGVLRLVVGEIVGETLRLTVGETVGETLRLMAGETVGETPGLVAGETVGETLGLVVGACLNRSTMKRLVL